MTNNEQAAREVSIQNTTHQLIEIEAIFVAEGRQRKDPKAAKPLLELKRSILSKGLLHAPVVVRRADGETGFQLVSGERRLLAITELHNDGLTFNYNGAAVPSGFAPYVLLSQLSAADLEEAELEENILRLALPWPEEIAAKLKIHELRKAQNPAQTLTETATEIVEVAGEASSTSPESERAKLTMAQVVQPYLGLPAVGGAKSLRKAYQAVLQVQKTQLSSELKKLSPTKSPHRIIHGDFLEISKTLEPGSFDLILSDPPYGVNMHQQSFERKHGYDDSRDVALALYREILRRGFNLLKPSGHIFLFCDIEHFTTIRLFAEQQAFSTWRTPIIWQKGFDGSAPWGRNGFARTYEIGLFAVKGQRPLQHGPEPDIKLVKRVDRQDRVHAAEKPPELLRWLLQLTCVPGNRVLDPCCGSAPILPAAKDLGLELTCIEQSKDYYDTALARSQSIDEEDTPEDTVARAPLTVDDLDAMLDD